MKSSFALTSKVLSTVGGHCSSRDGGYLRDLREEERGSGIGTTAMDGVVCVPSGVTVKLQSMLRQSKREEIPWQSEEGVEKAW